MGTKPEGIGRRYPSCFLALFFLGQHSPDTCIYVPTSPCLPEGRFLRLRRWGYVVHSENGPKCGAVVPAASEIVYKG